MVTMTKSESCLAARMLLRIFAFVDRIHRVGEAAMVADLVADAEQLELVGRFLFGNAERAGRLLVANLPQRAELVRRHERIPRRPERVDAGPSRRLRRPAAPNATAA